MWTEQHKNQRQSLHWTKHRNITDILIFHFRITWGSSSVQSRGDTASRTKKRSPKAFSSSVTDRVRYAFCCLLSGHFTPMSTNYTLLKEPHVSAVEFSEHCSSLFLTCYYFPLISLFNYMVFSISFNEKLITKEIYLSICLSIFLSFFLSQITLN